MKDVGLILAVLCMLVLGNRYLDILEKQQMACQKPITIEESK